MAKLSDDRRGGTSSGDSRAGSTLQRQEASGELSLPKPFSGERYTSMEQSVKGLSRALGAEVDSYAVSRLFATDRKGSVGLPPVPRRDPELCQFVGSLIEPINMPVRGDSKAIGFVQKMMDTVGAQVLNSYELEVLEFAVAHKDTIPLFIEPLTRNHALEQLSSGETRVVFGMKHHVFHRDYTPQEAFSTFVHELTHAREEYFGTIKRDFTAEIIVSEVHANAFGNAGKLGVAIRETQQNYAEDWGLLRTYMPGFDTLSALDQYKYMTIMAEPRTESSNALILQDQRLIEAFPQLEEPIQRAVQRINRQREFTEGALSIPPFLKQFLFNQ